MDLSIYLVGYFDIMGQADSLRGLKAFAKTAEDDLAIANDVGTKAATILQIRQELADLSHRAAQVTQPQLDALATPQARDQFTRIAPVDLRISGISDCFVLAAKLSPRTTFEGPEAWAKAAHSIRSVMVGLGGMMLKTLASKIPIRGGVEVGLAMDLTETEVYGRALSDAVAIEQTWADYPRIAVGPELIKMLRWIADRDPNQSVAAGFAVSQARSCLDELISGSDDGFPVAHFLSRLFLHFDNSVVSKPGESLRDFRRDADLWVKEEERRFAAINNHKLRARYHRLSRYFDTYPWTPSV